MKILQEKQNKTRMWILHCTNWGERRTWTCLYGQRAGHDRVDAVAEWVELLVAASQNVVLEQVTGSAVELERSQIQLHGEICKHGHGQDTQTLPPRSW